MSQPDFLPKSYTVKSKSDGSGYTVKRDLNAYDAMYVVGAAVGALSALGSKSLANARQGDIAVIEAHIANSEYQKALEVTTKWLNGNTVESKIFGGWQRTIVTRMMGQPQLGIETATKTLALLSKSSDVDAYGVSVMHFERGRCYQAAGQHGEAVRDFTESIHLRPDKDNLGFHYYRRGISLYELSSYDQALADMNHAIAIEPGHSRLYVARAAVQEQMGNIEAAVADCKVAIRLDPTSVAAYLTWATLTSTLSNDSRAVEILNSGIAANPDSSELISARLQCHTRSRAADLMLADQEKLVTLEAAKQARLAADAVQKKVDNENKYTSRFEEVLGSIRFQIKLTIVALVVFFPIGLFIWVFSMGSFVDAEKTIQDATADGVNIQGSHASLKKYRIIFIASPFVVALVLSLVYLLIRPLL